MNYFDIYNYNSKHITLSHSSTLPYSVDRNTGDILCHYGKIGMKWGYNDGKRNGNRTAEDEIRSGKYDNGFEEGGYYITPNEVKQLKKTKSSAEFNKAVKNLKAKKDKYDTMEDDYNNSEMQDFIINYGGRNTPAYLRNDGHISARDKQSYKKYTGKTLNKTIKDMLNTNNINKSKSSFLDDWAKYQRNRNLENHYRKLKLVND